MILKQGMKLTQTHSFNGMEQLPDDFTKEGWCIEDCYSIRTVGTIYVLHSKKIGSFISVDEEALKSFFTNWTSWKFYTVIHEGKPKIIQYRTNYRIVEVKYGQEKAKATCHKADEFSLNKGVKIAFERVIEKTQNKKHTRDKELKDKLADLLMSSYKKSFDKKIEDKKSQQKSEQKLIQINYMNQSILTVHAYHSIIHFSTYDEKVSKIFDEHFNLFDIKEGLAKERKWQKLTSFFDNNEDCDIMSTYGKNIITVFASERTPIVKMSVSAQQKVAKALINELIESNITYIALWEQEINDDFVNLLIKEAQSKNKKLDISIAK